VQTQNEHEQASKSTQWMSWRQSMSVAGYDKFGGAA